MKLLLDTHIFLWFISGDRKLPIHLQNSIRDLNNEVYLSCVSIWEATVKYQLGKLPLPQSPEIYLPKQRQEHLISSLGLDEESVAQLLNLPLLHRDPFDRMLICQALQHNLTVVSVDPAIQSYSIGVLY
ncbi:type II toxin-antitoxin system VapC family toxin [Nostoc sp. 2RC]|uniref:type II toxin-antitoxin system VapC family toxin n=1 Tax=Nostoc sp. 2RC TaxID=2485484 RepID=UPI00162333CA|nr:type II toxin-antitoxin system VapC family toxin [Nostoc sp. 2RC]MBC1240926.1 type II toxin-antitoxin system VapC family toxin [Nostoc sp. 2RC]